MKKIDRIFGTVLAWFDNPAFSFVVALVLVLLACAGADPIDGVPLLNISVFAFLVGTLMVAVLLSGSSIVLKKEYNWKAALYGAAGSALGTLLFVILAKTILA